MANTNELFPLDASEFAVRFRGGTTIFRHVFRRTVAADWEIYYDACAAEAADVDACESTAPLLLYGRVILRVEGYRTRDGRGPEKLPGWPAVIPQAHRLFAANLLLECFAGIATDTFDVGADRKTVSFVIVRDQNGDASERQLFGVTHHFRSPTMDHQKRFLRAMDEFPASARSLASLYDELAISAEGYSLGGAPLASEQLQSEMLMPHKMYAVAALLNVDPGLEPRRAGNVTLLADLLRAKKSAPAPRVEVH